MKPKLCKFQGDCCECLKRDEKFPKKQEKLEYLINIMKDLDPTSRYYKSLLKEVKRIKGDSFINVLAYNFCDSTYFLEEGYRQHTLAEVAYLLDSSISSIANTERKAIAKIRANLTEEQYDMFQEYLYQLKNTK